MHIVDLPGPHFALGIDVDSDRLVVVIGVHNFDDVRPGGQPRNGEGAILAKEATPGNDSVCRFIERRGLLIV